MAETIRDVIIKLSVKLGSVEMPDVSKIRTAFGQAAEVAAVDVSDAMKKVKLSTGQSVADFQAAELAKAAYAKQATKEFNQEAAARAGIAKRYAQDEIQQQRELANAAKQAEKDKATAAKQMSIERAGIAKAYERDAVKAQKEQAAEYAGVAKAYAAEEESKIRSAEDSKRASIEAASAMRLHFGAATEGLFGMAKGWALNRAASEGSLETAVRGLAKVQGVIESTKGAYQTLMGITKAYDAYRTVHAAGGATSVAGGTESAAVAGASSKLGGAGGLAFNPAVLVAIAVAAATKVYASHATAVQESLNGPSGISNNSSDIEVRYQKQRRARENTRGTSGYGLLAASAVGMGAEFLGTPIHALSGGRFGGHWGVQAEDYAKQKIGYASAEQRAENKKIGDADDVRRAVAIERYKAYDMAENQIGRDRQYLGARNTVMGGVNNNANTARRIALTERMTTMKDQSFREGINQEGDSNRLATFGARGELEIANLESTQKSATAQRELKEIEQERVQLKEKLKHFQAEEEGQGQAVEVKKQLYDLEQRQLGVLRAEGDQLNQNLKTRGETLASMKDSLRAEETRLRGNRATYGGLNESQQAQFKSLSDRVAGGEKLSRQELDRLDQVSGGLASPFTNKQREERGGDVSGILGKLGIKDQTEDIRKEIEQATQGGQGGVDMNAIREQIRNSTNQMGSQMNVLVDIAKALAELQEVVAKNAGIARQAAKDGRKNADNNQPSDH